MSARISPAPVHRDPMIGQLIAGRYRIDRIHAQGGMSVVYAAMYEAQQREVAIKVIDDAYSADPKAVERFMREARTASAISHGHVVGVSDYGILTNGRPYLVMPLITGRDLATLVAEEGPLPAARVVSLLSGVASALDWMHGQGLIHRDIKSENIMHVRGDDGTETALVLDFGIAARASVDDDDASGTPDFMAPEVLAGEPSDHRADIYSLATVAFELLAGRLPFQGNDLPELLRNRAKHRPRTLSEVTRIAFHPALEAAIARGLARKPADRPSSASELVLELKRAAAQARAPLTVPKPANGAAKTAAPQSGVRATARRRPVVRLRTLVGFPFSSSSAPPPPIEPSAERLPSIILDPSLQAAADELATARAREPRTQRVIEQPVIELPAPRSAPRAPAPPDSLSPLPELDLEPPRLRTSYTWLRVALPAAAVIAIVLFAWSRGDDAAPSSASSTAVPAPSENVAAAPRGAAGSTLMLPEPEPAPAPGPKLEPDPPAAAPVPSVPHAAPAVAARPRPLPARAEVPRASRTSPDKSAKVEAVRAPSGDAEQLATEGVNAMLRGDFQGALDKLQAATSANPRYAPAFRSKGLVLERLNRPKEAARAFQHYLRLSPHAADAEKIKARLAALQ